MGLRRQIFRQRLPVDVDAEARLGGELGLTLGCRIIAPAAGRSGGDEAGAAGEGREPRLPRRLDAVTKRQAPSRSSSCVTPTPRQWRIFDSSGRARRVPASWAAIKPGASKGAIPAKVPLNERARVTAGLAKEVEAVNQ